MIDGTNETGIGLTGTPAPYRITFPRSITIELVQSPS